MNEITFILLWILIGAVSTLMGYALESDSAPTYIRYRRALLAPLFGPTVLFMVIYEACKKE